MGTGPQVSKDQELLSLSPGLCNGQRGFPVQTDERGSVAGDVTVCGGDCENPAVPDRLGPAPLPAPRRGLLSPLAHGGGGSASRCATPHAAPQVTPLNPVLLS